MIPDLVLCKVTLTRVKRILSLRVGVARRRHRYITQTTKDLLGKSFAEILTSDRYGAYNWVGSESF